MRVVDLLDPYLTSQSIVMIDEIGKGTATRDGTCLAGALLEALDQRGKLFVINRGNKIFLAVYGIFSTHLHELFQIPIRTNLGICVIRYIYQYIILLSAT